MGEALLKGLLSANYCRPDEVLISSARRAPETAARLAVHAASPAEVAARAPIVILAFKPQQAERALAPLSLRSDQLCLSLLAGRSQRWLSERLSPARVLRAMPNLGAEYRQSATLLFSGEGVDVDDVERAHALFAAVGHVERLVDESLFHSGTALAGCAPAFFFLALEALADGAVAAGLPRAAAQRLARQAMLGAGALAAEGHPAELKDRVCSPGGVTIQGVRRLEEAGFRSALFEAVAGAAARSSQLEAQSRSRETGKE